jgi:phosphoribosylanthranilate isomerase
MLTVKLCGLNSREAVAAAARAHFAGFVHHPASPRHVEPAQAAALAAELPAAVRRVLVVVDPDDASLDRVVAVFRPDVLQLHGAESPARVGALRRRYAVNVIKAISVRDAEDLAAANPYLDLVDYLMFDAKPPRPGALPGGNAVSFDWRLLEGRTWPVPWFLSGGLTAENLSVAVGLSGARAVDVSSGVEDRPGVKSPARIGAFLAAAARL